MENILIVPGLRDSGPDHWQTWFQSRLPSTHRVEQDDWEKTCLSDWAQRVREAIDATPDPLWIVAHSFGCLASVTAALARPSRIRGALLVAPADPDRFRIAHALLEEKLDFPSLVVASENDPWVGIGTARHWAGEWGANFVNIGQAGHINVDSGYGPWPQGMAFFDDLRRRAQASD